MLSDSNDIESLGTIKDHQIIENKVEPPRENISEEAFWGNTTDPKEHDPGSFRYLVHAFNKYNEQANLGILAGWDTYSEEQAIDLLQKPDELWKRISLSMSLINQDHAVTWGPGGLIVRSPLSNIVIASNADEHVINSKVKNTRGSVILEPDELLKRTEAESYNEIVALGVDKEGRRLELAGFFFMTDIDGDPADYSTYERMAELASYYELPAVSIPYTGYRWDGIRVDEQKRRVANYKSKGYTIDTPYERFCFDVSTGAKVYFASRSEIEEVINYYIDKNQMTPEEGQDVLNRYEKIYKLRMRPVLASEGPDRHYITFRDKVGPCYAEYFYTEGKLTKVVHEGSKITRASIEEEEFTEALRSVSNNMTSDELQAILDILSQSY